MSREQEPYRRLTIAMPFARDNHFKFYLRRSVTPEEWAKLMEIIELAKESCVEPVPSLSSPPEEGKS